MEELETLLGAAGVGAGATSSRLGEILPQLGDEDHTVLAPPTELFLFE